MFLFSSSAKENFKLTFSMHGSYSRLNQSPSVACINHEFFLTWQNPFTRSKFMGMERRFCFAYSSTCNVTTRWSGNYLLTGFTLDRGHILSLNWKWDVHSTPSTDNGRALRRRDDIAAAVGSNWSIKHRSQGMYWTKNLKHGCLFVHVRLLCYLTRCSL